MDQQLHGTSWDHRKENSQFYAPSIEGQKEGLKRHAEYIGLKLDTQQVGVSWGIQQIKMMTVDLSKFRRVWPKVIRLFCLMPEGNSFNGHLKWMFPYSGPLRMFWLWKGSQWKFIEQETCVLVDYSIEVYNAIDISSNKLIKKDEYDI